MIRPARLVSLVVSPVRAAARRTPVTEGDFIVRHFARLREVLPELLRHYRTLGTPRKVQSGIVRNAVLIMNGTGGTGAQFLGANFAGERFGRGQPARCRAVLRHPADDIGHGKSSKPSDGLRARFPRYGYATWSRPSTAW